MIKINVVLITLQLILLSIGAILGYGVNNIQGMVYTTLMLYGVAFFIVNHNKTNLVNLSTFFLIGFGLLILGRFIGYVVYPEKYDFYELFCFDFFFSYCLTNIESINIIFFFNLSLLVFCLGYVFSVSQNVGNNKSPKIIDKKISKSSIKLFLIPISYLLLIILFYNLLNTIKLALSGGYMALYASQAEAYQTPFTLIINSTLIAILAILFTNTSQKKPISHFKIVFYLLILLGLISILSGSRNGFIGALFVLLWHLFYDKKVSKLYYSVVIFFGLIVIASTNYLSDLLEVRGAGVESNMRASISDAFYSQGGTFLIVNEALKIDNPPLLGYLKTLLPGIQILFTSFGVTERYKFDWSSNLAYKLDKILYQEGFGLGWSVFADLYFLAFGILPLYLIMLFFWGKWLNILDSKQSQFIKAASFIFVFYVFALPRNSISPVLFTLLIYLILVSLLRMRIAK